MPHDSMTQPCWFPFLSCSCSHSTTHTGILPAYRQNSHDAKQQTARTACQPLITANKSTSISTPHTICIQNIPLHLSCSRCKLQSFHSKYKALSGLPSDSKTVMIANTRWTGEACGIYYSAKGPPVCLSASLTGWLVGSVSVLLLLLLPRPPTTIAGWAPEASSWTSASSLFALHH